jgi:hypothetical protein
VRETFELSLNMEREDLPKVETKVEKEVEAEKSDEEHNNDREGKFKCNFKLNTLNSPFLVWGLGFWLEILNIKFLNPR